MIFAIVLISVSLNFIQFILALFIAILFMSCGEFPRGKYVNLVEFG